MDRLDRFAEQAENGCAYAGLAILAGYLALLLYAIYGDFSV
jgi:hypothetical protein